MSSSKDNGIRSQEYLNEAGRTFELVLPDIFAPEFNELSPSKYVDICWKRYQSYAHEHDVSHNNKSGCKFLEYLIASVLIREGLCPFFVSAKVAFVPSINHDIVMYAESFGLISISIEPDLMQQYKLVDLAARVTKSVHRKAQCIAITLLTNDSLKISNKLQDGTLTDLDAIIHADLDEFDQLISRLKRMQFKQPEPIPIITSSKIIGGTAHT